MSPTKKGKGAPPPAEQLIPADVSDESRLAGWGPVIRHWIKAGKTTQVEVAKKIGMSQPAISAWINGKGDEESGRNLPTWGTIKAIAAACGVDLADNIVTALLLLPAEEQALVRQLVQALASGDDHMRRVVLPALKGALEYSAEQRKRQ